VVCTQGDLSSGLVWHIWCEGRTVHYGWDGTESWFGAKGYGMWVWNGG
jgi:hypothetical protein